MQVVFLFTDEHVVHESFLEILNNMLTTGTIPALFDASEKETLTQGIREEIEASGETPTKELCWNRFLSRCRDNLHIIVVMSPVGPSDLSR